MTSNELLSSFEEYLGFIKADIEREIRLGTRPHTDQCCEKQGANLLAALGLVCYTEFMGGVVRGLNAADPDGAGLATFFVPKEGAENFRTFFREMGAAYSALLSDAASKDKDVYSMVRCGLVHEFGVKEPCMVKMGCGAGECGIWKDEGGRWWFSVEQYYADFVAAAERVRSAWKDKFRIGPVTGVPPTAGPPPPFYRTGTQ